MGFIDGVGDEVIVAIVVTLLIILSTAILNAAINLSPHDFWSLITRNFLREEQFLDEPDDQLAEAAPGNFHADAENNVGARNNAGIVNNVGINNNIITGDNVDIENNTDASNNTTTENNGSTETCSPVENTESIDAGSTDCEQPSPAEDVVADENTQQGNETPENQGQETSESVGAQEHSPNSIRVRLKYLNDTERVVTADCTTKVKEFKRSNFADDIANNRTVRLIFNGGLLLDHKSLAECCITDGTVVHVHVSQAPSPQQAARDVDNNLDISNLFWPLFAVVLGICWMSYLHYPQYFNVPSFVLLIVFTISFLIACTHSSVEAS